MRAAALAIVAADGVDGQGGIERFVQYLSQQYTADAPELRWFIQKTRFGHGVRRHMTVPLALAQFAWRCASGQVAIAHINVAPQGSTFRKMLFSAVAKAFGVKTMIHLHGSAYDTFYESCPPPVRRLIRRFFASADRVAVLGDHWSKVAREQLGVAPERLLIVQNGVPEPAVMAEPDHEKAHLVFAGELGERKGVDVLLDALKLLNTNAGDWRATLAGGGDIDRFRRQAEEAGVAEKVRFTGWLAEAEMGALMSSADIFVLPSREEAQPIAILEAIARGLPVVSTPVGSIPEQVHNGVSGLLTTPGDARSLAAALERLVRDAAERRAMGQAGRALFLRRYSIRQCAAAFRDVYAEMLAPGAGRRAALKGSEADWSRD